MRCPYCGEEMERGYIQCRDHLIWDQKKRLVAAIPMGSDASVSLGEQTFSGTTVEAHHCKECRKIVIDY